jgi:hypothetical protein
MAKLQLGARVRIKNYPGPTGRIVELRGALGPNGMEIYRVAVPRKPGSFLVEVRGNQLELLTTKPRRLVVLKTRKPKHPKTLRKRSIGGHGSIV